MQLILASASPRRQELLRLLTPDFLVHASDADEALPNDISPERAPVLLARRKAEAVAALFPNAAVIGSDTVVTIGGEILGKPDGPADAARMLRLLSGRTHWVCTGVCVVSPGAVSGFFERTAVTFAPMSEREILAYAASGEPDDKAGAYAVQGIGARFIERIEGDYYTVMGLPVCRLYRLLSDGGLL